MWPLLACSIVSVTVMILRGLALQQKKVMPPVPGADRSCGVATFARTTLGKRRSSSDARASRDGAPGKRSHHSRSHCGHCAAAWFDRRSFRIGACFFPSGTELGRIGYAADCARHRRSIECNRVRAFDCRTDLGRVHLFFEKSRSDVGGDGNAGRRANQQMLLRALLARIWNGKSAAHRTSTDSDAARVKRAAHLST